MPTLAGDQGFLQNGLQGEIVKLVNLGDAVRIELNALIAIAVMLAMVRRGGWRRRIGVVRRGGWRRRMGVIRRGGWRCQVNPVGLLIDGFRHGWKIGNFRRIA